MRTANTKLKPYPNKATAWSYFMQAIEPNDPKINEIFPEYHPMWIIQSQKKTVSGENFKLMREHIVRMSRDECAAYLRVHVATVRKWEAGTTPVPFVTFEILRLVSENVHFKLSDKSWQGWYINGDGRLISPDRGKLSFSPDELSFIRETHNANGVYKSENSRLQKENELLRKEISKYKVIHLNNESKTTPRAIEEKAA